MFNSSSKTLNLSACFFDILAVPSSSSFLYSFFILSTIFARVSIHLSSFLLYVCPRKPSAFLTESARPFCFGGSAFSIACSQNSLPCLLSLVSPSKSANHASNLDTTIVESTNGCPVGSPLSSLNQTH